ncbi:hypothetical protein ACFW04_000206 [Cataglyphis niger]
MRNLSAKSRDLECPPTTLPTCYQYSRYPPGCIVLECRSEADRPVVRVVQVPAKATARNSCSPVKTRSTFDPMISRRKDIKQQSSVDICSQNQNTDKFILLPISNILKSEDCADDLVALTDKITIETISTPILKIDRHEKQSDDRELSKIGYCPISKTILETSCDDRSPNQPLIFIKCAATPEIRDPFFQITCKNDLDSSEISNSSKKCLNKFERQICPARCNQPVRQSAIREVCKDFPHANSVSDVIISPICIDKDDRSFDEQLQCPTSKRMMRTDVTQMESAKSDKASACQRSTVPFKCACFIPQKISKDTPCLSSSQELLARYKEHIPIHLLEKYEICRSKRNGLQDDCALPFLQGLIRKEEKRRLDCFKHKRNIVNQNGMNKSMNHDQSEVLYLG